MLEILPLNDFQEKKSYFQKQTAANSTWIVSDLKSKLQLQNQLLKKQPVIADDSVVRASELWSTLLNKMQPTTRFVSSDYMKLFLSEQLQLEEFSWAQTPGASETLFQFLNQLLPILLDPEGDQLINHWFQDNDRAVIRFGHWYQLAKKVWQNIQQQGLIISKWAPCFLHSNVNGLTIEKKLIFDLGADLTLIEAELIQRLSETNDITVIKPNSNWVNNYPECLLGYQLLGSKSFETKKQPLSVLRRQGFSLFKYSTPVSEVKSTVAKIRLLVDDCKVSPSEIAIVAPNIEKYWPTLKAYLKQEGVACNKPSVCNLSHFSEISIWCHRLNLQTGKLNTSELEMDLYQPDAEVPLSFEKYKILFANIFSESDIRRHDFVYDRYSKQVSADEVMTRQQFIEWALLFWNNHWPTERLKPLFEEYFRVTPKNQVLSLHRWIYYIQTLASKTELTIEPANTLGVYCENINAIEWLDIKHLFILGTSEQQMVNTTDLGLATCDVEKISTDTGFNLIDQKQYIHEFDLIALIENCKAEIVMSYAQTDFNGSTTAPSKIWLIAAIENDKFKKKLDTVIFSRWDELQNQPLSSLMEHRDFSEEKYNQFVKSIHRDLGESYSVGKMLIDRLSVSQAENYLKCPFWLTAQKVWKLSDLPEVDLDIDRMTTGKLMHAVFEELLKEPIKFDLTEEELTSLIKNLIKKLEVFCISDVSQSQMIENTLQLAQRFLQHEKNWRQQLPKTKTVARELKIQGFWNLAEQDFSNSGELSFLGFIDRVDTAGDDIVALIDYKSSEAQAKNHKSWLASESLQMPMYAAALEKGLSELGPRPVMAAHYFVAKTMNRSKGFTIKEGVEDFLPKPKHHTQAISESEKLNLYKETKQAFNEVAKKVLAGFYEPKPAEFKLCGNCSWSKICRATHLNR
jgi:ATP-dependent helicase/nuclease subunit B